MRRCYSGAFASRYALSATRLCPPCLTPLQYGFSASLFLDLFPVLSSRLISRTATTTGAAGCAAIYATGEGLIHACAKSAGITWPQPLALLDPALALIAEMRLNANPTLPALSLVSSAMAYLAACVTPTIEMLCV